MPKVVVAVDAKGIQRFGDATFGDMGIFQVMRDVEYTWLNSDGDGDPGLTLGQSNALARLLRDGVSLEIAEDGTVTINRPSVPVTPC